MRMGCLVAGLAVACACSPIARVPQSPSTRLRPTFVPWIPPERAVCVAGHEDVVEGEVLGDERVLEASGVVASLINEDVLWLHNDSGDEAVIYAVATDGTALGALRLTDVNAIDIEDMAAATCPDLSGPCLYLADTGDNDRERDNVIVYAVPEPTVTVAAPLSSAATADRVWRFPLVLPEPINIEAMVVTPDLTGIVLFEKVEGEARVLRVKAPWQEGGDNVVEVIGTATVPGAGKGARITGADLHPSGQRLALRSYLGVYEFNLGGGAALSDLASLELEAVTEAEYGEPQGEAIAYLHDGTTIVTVSESVDGSPVPLHFFSCSELPSAP
jgi:hypothetical protein